MLSIVMTCMSSWHEEVNTEFGSPNYPSNKALYDTESHMVTLKFKHELAGLAMEEFCSLKPKMYLIQTKCMCNIKTD